MTAVEDGHHSLSILCIQFVANHLIIYIAGLVRAYTACPCVFLSFFFGLCSKGRSPITSFQDANGLVRGQDPQTGWVQFSHIKQGWESSLSFTFIGAQHINGCYPEKCWQSPHSSKLSLGILINHCGHKGRLFFRFQSGKGTDGSWNLALKGRPQIQSHAHISSHSFQNLWST